MTTRTSPWLIAANLAVGLAVPATASEPASELSDPHLIRAVTEVLRSDFGLIPYLLTPVAGRLYFSDWESVGGRELWVTDGTAAGTRRLRDIAPGEASSDPWELTALGERLLFTASGPSGRELWTSDGTPQGTVEVADIAPGQLSSYPTGLTAVGGVALFSANSNGVRAELWRSDGTPEGTSLLKDLMPGTATSFPERLLRAGRLVYFSALDPAHGRELWVTDGTPEGTRLVADLVPGFDSSEAAPVGRIGRTLLIAARDLEHGTALWGLHTPLALSQPTDTAVEPVDVLAADRAEDPAEGTTPGS